MLKCGIHQFVALFLTLLSILQRNIKKHELVDISVKIILAKTNNSEKEITLYRPSRDPDVM